MTDRELLQMALDALEEYCEHNAMLRPIERRDALRAALAQPEQEEDYDAIANKQLASLKAAAKVTFEDAVVRAVHKLYNAPPQQPEQDDGYCQACEGNYCTAKDGCVARDNPPQREFYCGCGDEIVSGDGARCGTCVAVKYKEKEWVGFTQEEHQAAMRTDGSFGAGFLYAEKLLKEKNT